jgi:hypothetical protein
MEFLVLTANWWEPGQSGQLDIGDLSAILMFFLALVGAVITLIRWSFKKLRKMIREEVQEFTKPIQPTANGGLSLPDVARRVDSVEAAICELKDMTSDNKDLLVKLAIDMATKSK